MKDATTTTKHDPDPDSTRRHLEAARSGVNAAIEHVKSACRNADVDESLGDLTLTMMRSIRDEIEAELAEQIADQEVRG